MKLSAVSYSTAVSRIPYALSGGANFSPLRL